MNEYICSVFKHDLRDFVNGEIFDVTLTSSDVIIYLLFRSSRLFDQPSMQTQSPEPISTHQSMIT